MNEEKTEGSLIPISDLKNPREKIAYLVFEDGDVIRKMASEFLIPVATRIETAKAIVDALERRGYYSIMRPIALNEVLESTPYGKYV